MSSSSSAAQAAPPPHNRAELFIGGADEEFLCGICLDILHHPHSCCKEGHTYCLTCITDALKSKKQCPTCCQSVVGTSGLMKNRYLQNTIEKLTVGCPHGDSSSITTQETLPKRLKLNYQHPPPRLLAAAGRVRIRTCLNTWITTASWRCATVRCKAVRKK
jgi:hypothetical protein